MQVNREYGTSIENVELKRDRSKESALFKVPKRIGSHCIWKGNVRSLWTRQLEMKEYSQTHGIRIPRTPRILPAEKIAKKKTKLSKYFEPDFSTLREGKMAPGKYFSTTERKASAKISNPAPGTYFPDIFKHSSVVKKSFTKTPTFEWSGLQDRFKLKINDSWKPPVGSYNAHKINCIDRILAKRVSKKGPYQLFTGPRDNTTIMNRFKLVPETLDKFYTLPNDLNYLLHHPEKKRYGVVYREKAHSLTKSTKMVETPGPATYSIFGSSFRYGVMYRERMSALRELPKMVETPGPATYNITSHTIKVAPPGKAPFNSNHYEQARADAIAPGPGRYFLTDPEERREGMKEVESRHLRPSEVSSRQVVATPRLRRKKMQERKKLQEGTLPTHVSLQSRKLIQKLVKLQSEKKSHWEADKESHAGSNYVHTEKDGWYVVPLAIKAMLLKHPAVKDTRVIGLPVTASKRRPFVLVELKPDCRATEAELLYFINQKLLAEEKITSGLRIIRNRVGES